MGSLLDDHMQLIFFLYGLAFFLLGTAILMQPRRGSAFNIGNTLWLLGCFGILHGLSEWMDMFPTLGQKYWTPFGTVVLRIASFYFAAASFVCLLQFSLKLILLNGSKRQFLERIALMSSLLFLVAITSYGVVTGFSNQWLILSQVLMRYTSKVVRNPAEWPCSLRFRPIKAPATTVSASRKAISGHSIVIGIGERWFLVAQSSSSFLSPL